MRFFLRSIFPFLIGPLVILALVLLVIALRI